RTQAVWVEEGEVKTIGRCSPASAQCGILGFAGRDCDHGGLKRLQPLGGRVKTNRVRITDDDVSKRASAAYAFLPGGNCSTVDPFTPVFNKGTSGTAEQVDISGPASLRRKVFGACRPSNIDISAKQVMFILDPFAN